MFWRRLKSSLTFSFDADPWTGAEETQKAAFTFSVIITPYLLLLDSPVPGK
jgi:hypothetical protein